jgi:hypothetical protein
MAVRPKTLAGHDVLKPVCHPCPLKIVAPHSVKLTPYLSRMRFAFRAEDDVLLER